MLCNHCQKPVSENDKFCPYCGGKVTATVAKATPMAPAAPTVPQEPVVQPPVVQAGKQELTEEDLPARYRPLSAWAYFGYTLLFSLPIAGFILLIVFSCNSNNINRRNYARSYWCALILVAIVVLVLFLLTAIAGVSLAGLLESSSSSHYYY